MSRVLDRDKDERIRVLHGAIWLLYHCGHKLENKAERRATIEEHIKQHHYTYVPRGKIQRTEYDVKKFTSLYSEFARDLDLKLNSKNTTGLTERFILERQMYLPKLVEKYDYDPAAASTAAPENDASLSTTPGDASDNEVPTEEAKALQKLESSGAQTLEISQPLDNHEASRKPSPDVVFETKSGEESQAAPKQSAPKPRATSQIVKLQIGSSSAHGQRRKRSPSSDVIITETKRARTIATSEHQPTSSTTAPLEEPATQSCCDRPTTEPASSVAHIQSSLVAPKIASDEIQRTEPTERRSTQTSEVCHKDVLSHYFECPTGGQLNRDEIRDAMNGIFEQQKEVLGNFFREQGLPPVFSMVKSVMV